MRALQMAQPITGPGGRATPSFYNLLAELQREVEAGAVRAAMLSMMDPTTDSNVSVTADGFRVNYTSGAYQVFEVAGPRILAVENGTGGRTEYGYSQTGQLQSVTHTGGGAIF